MLFKCLKRFSLLASALLFVTATVCDLTANAAPVDGAKAKAVAESFLTHTLGAKDASGLKQQTWKYEGVHLFTLPSQGWVMVAADDCARPVLAYSLTGTIHPDRMPVALQNIVDVYQQEIDMARKSKDMPTDDEWKLLAQGKSLAEDEEEVGPLLTTQWYQRSPYNMYCPSYTMTGCVATAMAQVMKYWNYPAFGEGSHSYSDNSGYGIQSADFANTRYDWSNMPDRLTSASPAEQKHAVATLMYHCGVSVDMGYSTIYSGTTINKCETALPTYFHYNRHDIRYRAKGSMSNDAWTDTLIAELRLRRPILHGGSGPAGGHCFICDGFNAQRYLHFNLGEDGDGDGYYQVGAITYGAYAFNQANDAILGVHPEYGIYLSSESLSFNRFGDEQQVWFCTSDTTSAPWTATPSENWITVSGTDFAHLGQVTIGVSDNNSGQERSGTVTFTQGARSVTLRVMQNAYDPATDYCPLTVEMENTHGEPWAGDAHLSFESVGGTVYGVVSHTASSNSSTATVDVAPRDVMVRWHAGGALDRYINYRIKNRHGEVLVNVQNAYFEASDVLLAWPCNGLGIADDMAKPIALVRPNPTSDFVQVEIPEGGGTLSVVSVLDAAGRELMRMLPGEGQSATCDLRALSSGIYYLRVLTSESLFVNKVVKN